MMVLDASAIVEFLLGTDLGRLIADRIADPALGLHVPHLVNVEVTQILGRYVQSGILDPDSAHAALRDLGNLDLERNSHEPLLDRLWALRDSVTAHDVAYGALAEALDVRIELVGGS